MTTRALGYVRLSKLTEASTSPERQRADIARYATGRGWELVDIVEDIDVSATKHRLDRPGIHELRKRVKADPGLVVIVSRLDRIARNVADVSTLLDEGIAIVSVAEAFDTASASGRAMAQVAQVFAELEARTIGLRVASSRKHLPTVGRWPGGRLPYGFTTASDGKAGRTLVHDPHEAPVVRRAVEEVLAGVGVHEVTRRLNADGIRNRTGHEWDTSTLTRILRHGTIRGHARLHGDVVRDERGLPAEVWPPLVSREEARELDRLLKPGASPVRYAERPDALLAGVALCSGCGRLLVPRFFGRPAGPPAPLYACQTRNRGGECPTPQTVTAAPAEEVAERRFLASYGRAPVMESVIDDIEPEGLADVLAAKEETQAAFGRPGADYMALAARMATLDAELTRLSRGTNTATRSRATGETIRELWERSTTAERRAIMRGAEAYVVVRPAKARGHFDADRIDLLDYSAGTFDDEGSPDEYTARRVYTPGE
jgi:DNA invertase Pin-like site-specific DNA recombinase